jgi:membrane-associated protease RseP (regulator of RpoE activity)
VSATRAVSAASVAHASSEGGWKTKDKDKDKIVVVSEQVISEKDSPTKKIVIARSGGGSFLGVGVADIDADRVKALSLKDESGVEVTNVVDGSAAAKAGIQKGDVILDYNGQRVESTSQFIRMVRETPVGRTVKIGTGFIYRELLKQIVEFFRTGKSPVEPAVMLEITVGDRTLCPLVVRAADPWRMHRRPFGPASYRARTSSAPWPPVRLCS